MILNELNQALRLAGYGAYTGTHILRHSMGAFSRKEGSLDVAQARLDVNDKVTGIVIRAEKLFQKNVTKIKKT